MSSQLSYDLADTLIREVEEKYDLLQFEIDQWCIWPHFRANLQSALVSAPAGRLRARSRSRRLAEIIADAPKLLFLPKISYLLCTYSTSRCEMSNGQHEDIFFDALAPQLGSFLKIEAVNNDLIAYKGRNAVIKSDLKTTVLDTLASAAMRMSQPREVDEVSAKMSAMLTGEARLSFCTPHYISNAIRSFLCLKRSWRWFLNHLKPKQVIVADTCQTPIAAAAKELGITFNEMQHGIMDCHHSGYSWTSYARPYKARMPVPDRLLMFGEHWCKELRTNGFWDDELFAVGSSRIERYRTLQKIQQPAPDNVRSILVTTQGVDTQRLIQFLQDFLTHIQSMLPVKLYIKLHPVYDSDKAPFEKALGRFQNVVILAGDESPGTFELLTRAQLHLSISSACHYDALGLGIPTVVLPLNGSEIVQNLIDSGHAFRAESPKELADYILSERRPDINGIGNYYFTADALHRTRDALEQPLKKEAARSATPVTQ
jgi:hypothetical protein